MEPNLGLGIIHEKGPFWRKNNIQILTFLGGFFKFNFIAFAFQIRNVIFSFSTFHFFYLFFFFTFDY